MTKLPISAVVCVWDRECYLRCSEPWLRKLVDDVVEVASGRSIFEAYNRGRELSKHETILYVHEDVRLLEHEAFRKWVSWFMESDYRLAGVIGAEKLLVVPWWQNPSVGAVIQGGERLHHQFGTEISEPADAVSLDGLFLLARMPDFCWPEDSYSDWHFYDAEISMAAGKGGLVVLPIPVHHVCRDKSREILPGFMANGRLFEVRHGVRFSSEFWVADPGLLEGKEAVRS